MSLLCPECRETLEEPSFVCRSGHRFEMRDGVLSLLSANFIPRFEDFSAAVADYRQELGKRILDETVYEKLPHGEAEKGDLEWRQRVWDLECVRRLLRARGVGRVLDVGSFNGWLSRHLSDDGHQVTAIDTFADPYDGLGARRFYRDARWRSVQIDQRDLSILGGEFDTVVLNRCLQFFPDPVAYFEHAQEQVVPGGMVLATGLELYCNPRQRETRLELLDREFRLRYGMDFFLYPTRGLLDRAHFAALSDRGMRFSWVPQLTARNLLSLLFRSRPRFFVGVWWRDT